eukprot:3059795-Pyramimonas_sp.AAC.1
MCVLCIARLLRVLVRLFGAKVPIRHYLGQGPCGRPGALRAGGAPSGGVQLATSSSNLVRCAPSQAKGVHRGSSRRISSCDNIR